MIFAPLKRFSWIIFIIIFIIILIVLIIIWIIIVCICWVLFRFSVLMIFRRKATETGSCWPLTSEVIGGIKTWSGWLCCWLCCWLLVLIWPFRASVETNSASFVQQFLKFLLSSFFKPKYFQWWCRLGEQSGAGLNQVKVCVPFNWTN